MESTQPDAIDYAILYHLQRDGRCAVTDIADELDVVDDTVRNRLQKLEDNGIIEGHQANVNYDRAGIQHHYLFVCSARVSERESLARDAGKLPKMTEVMTLMTGKRNVYIIGSGDEKDDITDLAYDIDKLGLTIESEFLLRDHARKTFEAFELENNL